MPKGRAHQSDLLLVDRRDNARPARQMVLSYEPAPLKLGLERHVGPRLDIDESYRSKVAVGGQIIEATFASRV